MLLGGPAAEIGTAFRDQRQRHAGAQAVNLRQIGPGELVQQGASIEARRVGLLGTVAGLGQRLPGLDLVGAKQLQRLFDLRIAVGDPLLIAVEQFQRLGQSEDVLGLVVTYEGLADGLGALAAANVTHRSERVGVALALDDGADDLQASRAADVADDVVQLQVHVGQRLLHVLHVGCRVLEMPLADAHVGAQRRDLTSRPEAGPQQAAGMQALQPLGVVDVTLAAWHGFAVTRVGKHDNQATVFQYLVDRHPVHAGGLHRHGGDAHRDQPVGHALDVAREAMECLHRLVAEFGRHCHHLDARANVDAGSVRVYDGQAHRLHLLVMADLLLAARAPDRGAGQITFLNGVAQGATTAESADSPWTRFFDGDVNLQKADGHSLAMSV